MAKYEGRSHMPGPVLGSSIRRTCKISASKTSGALFPSVRNPEKTAIIAEVVRVLINKGSNAACTVSIGTKSTDASSANQIDSMSVNTSANTVYDSITDHGTLGKTRQYVAAGDYFTAYVASGDANGLSMDVQWDYRTLTGGNP